ncbi:transposase [Micromonospora sp. KC207]|nr:transposase [Micromonospora sp. KC207]
MFIMEGMGKKPRRPRRAFTPEFKAEIVEVCRRGDRTIAQVARDFDLTETAVREWVRQADLDAGTRSDGVDQRRAGGAGAAAAGEPPAARGRRHPQTGHGEFNRSLQHWAVVVGVAVRRRPRLGSSSQGSCGAGC